MSGLRILIINTDYPEFLEWLYSTNPGLAEAPYDDQIRARAESLFGVADFYSRHFQALGYDAIDVHANNEAMQNAWAHERGLSAETTTVTASLMNTAGRLRRAVAQTPLRHLKPLLRPALDVLDRPNGWFHKVLASQIEEYQPDVIFNLSVGPVSGRFLVEMRSRVRLLVGQIASPLPPEEDLRGYDLIVSSLTNFVDRFRNLGMASELSRFAFEPSILQRLRPSNGSIGVSFVGSLSRAHKERLTWLEEVATRCDVQVWGPVAEDMCDTSIVGRHRGGMAWGAAMYQILADSKVTLNCHIGIAESYANNMRLFEATGVGTLLITDWKKNLDEMFAVGTEVVAYRTPAECAELVGHYLDNDREREAVARRGQARTLADHTYRERTHELAAVFEKYL
jgi:hypothetical protein